MLGLLKRHEVEILLKAGHKRTEVARLTGISPSSVQRIAGEEPIEHFNDAAERRKRRIGRPSVVRGFRKIISDILENGADLSFWTSFAKSGRPVTVEARPPFMPYWPHCARSNWTLNETRPLRGWGQFNKVRSCAPHWKRNSVTSSG